MNKMKNRTISRSMAASLCSLLIAACGGGGGGGKEDASDDTGLVLPTGATSIYAVIGDYGDTVPLADGPDVLQVANMIDGWKPAAIFTVGDNDYSDGAYASEPAPARYTGLELGVGQYFHAYIGNYIGSSGPGAAENRFFPVPGDHDYGDDCDNPRLGPYLEYFTLPAAENGDETYYDVRYGPVHVFALDSIIDCHQDGGAKIAAQKAWLETAAKASDAPFKIVLTQNPPYSSGTRHVGGGDHMRWDYAAWGINMVIGGDDHIYERIQRDGIVYLVDGLGGLDIDKGFANPPDSGSVVRYNAEHGALRLDVFESDSSNRLVVSFVAIDGSVRDQFQLNDGTWYQPALDSTWQWQLSGTVNTTYAVDLYDIDLFDVPAATIAQLQAAGKHVICYFSAGTYENFRPDAADFTAITPNIIGNQFDPPFNDENWIDIRNTDLRSIMLARLDLAASKGCDGVEPDNVDAYDGNNPGFPITAADQLDYNRFLANEAHARGLAVGLKNDLGQIVDLVGDFDFAVNEQCHEYNECADLLPFVQAGKPVFVAEYADVYVNNTGGARDTLCASSLADNLHTLVLPLDLDDSFRYSCDP